MAIKSELKFNSSEVKAITKEIKDFKGKFSTDLTDFENKGRDQISDFAYKAFNESEEFYSEQEQTITETELFMIDWSSISDDFIKAVQKVDYLRDVIGVKNIEIDPRKCE